MGWLKNQAEAGKTMADSEMYKTFTLPGGGRGKQ